MYDWYIGLKTKFISGALWLTGQSEWHSFWGRRWGTAAAVPLPFRPSEPALCGSCPL